MFDLIDSKKIDIRSISDLKEYVNDLESSILRMDTIMEFEKVVRYWQFVK